MSIAIRKAVDADLPAILAIIDEAYSPYVAHIGKKPGPMLDDYAALIADGAVDVAVDDAGVAGLVVFVPLEGKGLLDNVAVANRAKGRGIGRLLIDHAEGLARAAGFREIILYTHVMMTENRALYTHLGYRETHRAVENGFDRVYFSKMLVP
jgi:GNAT superfamily N-acetyltransferase